MEFLSYLISGISLGSISAIIALGYTMVYGIAKMLNFAHGDIMKIDGQPMLKFLNRIFRSRTLRWLFSWGVHPDWALRFGHWWSGRSRKGHGEEAARGASLTEPYTGSSAPHAAPPTPRTRIRPT